MRESTDGPVKIGSTTSLGARHKQMQCGNPRPLMLVWTLPGALAEERALHAKFAAHRLGGEWFAPADEILAHAPPVSESESFVASKSGAARAAQELKMDAEWLERAKRRVVSLAHASKKNHTGAVRPMWERKN
jgi:hypothetical protein